MKRKIGLLCICALLMTGCGKIPKLSNGNDAVITFKDGQKISVDDLYNTLKNDYALETLITLMDTHIFETEFADKVDDSKSYAENYVKAMKESYGGEDKLLQAIQQNTKFSTIEAYQKYLYLSYLQSMATEEYAKLQITDKQIKKYYDETAKGQVDLNHILITADVTDKMTADEKKAAETKAKDLAKSLIDKINKSDDKEKTFKELVKENTKDDKTKSKDGSLGKVTYGDIDKKYNGLLDAAYKIKDKEVYGEIVTTELGYHIVFKTKSYEKEELEKVSDKIKKILAEELQSKQKDIALKALQHYRKEYGMEIQDSEIQKQYARYIQNMAASIQQQIAEENKKK
ncbi:MAG: peptidylprolyl isomerase [Bacilli bacterium]